MQTAHYKAENATLHVAEFAGNQERGVSLLKPILLLAAIIICNGSGFAGTYLTLSQAVGGVAIAQPTGTTFQTSFGNVNALGIGPASQAGVTISAQNNGAMYYSQVKAKVGCLFGNCVVNAYVSANFTHTAALVMYACPSASACNSSANYSALSTNSGAPTAIVSPAVANGTTVTIGFAFWVPDNNGASAYTGTDNATVTFNVIDTSFFNINLETDTLTFNNPLSSVQTGVQLDLATDPSGITVTAAADYSMNFGNVNALGIGVGAGLTTVAHAGGIIYSTVYDYKPAFTGFSSSNGTVKVYVSTDFAHSAVLSLYDAAAAAGPYNAISKNSGAQTQITTTASSRSTNSRYLGLFISNVNGATAFTGTDTATLTYTLTVP